MPCLALGCSRSDRKEFSVPSALNSSVSSQCVAIRRNTYALNHIFLTLRVFFTIAHLLACLRIAHVYYLSMPSKHNITVPTKMTRQPGGASKKKTYDSKAKAKKNKIQHNTLLTTSNHPCEDKLLKDKERKNIICVQLGRQKPNSPIQYVAIRA